MKFKIKEGIRDRFLLGVIGILAIHTIANIVWLKIDTFPLWFDYGGYFKRSVEMYYALQTGCLDFVRAVLGIGEYRLNSYQPHRLMFPLSSIPFYCLFGVSEDTAVMSCVLFLAIALFSTYAIASRIFDGRTGLLAAFILSVSPGFFAFSRRYSPEFAATAMVALTAYFLLKSDNFRNRFYSILVGFSFAFGMLVKEMVFVFIFPIVIYTFYNRDLPKVSETKSMNSASNFSQRNKSVLINLAISLSVAVIFIFPVYWLHRNRVFYQIFDIAYSSQVRESYKMPAIYSPEGILFYIRNIINFSFIPFGIVFSIAGIFFCLIRKIKAKGLIFCWLIFPYLIFSFVQTKAGEYGMPLLIPLSILASYGLMELIRNKKIRRVMITLVVSWGVLVFLSYSFPFIKGFSLKQVDRNSHMHPTREDWKLSDIVDYIKDNLSTFDRAASVHIGSNLYPFSSMTFAYVAMLKKLPLVFGGYNIKPEEALSFDFVIVKEGDNQGLFYSEAQAKQLKQLLDNAPNFIKLPKTFVLPDNSIVNVYKNKL